MNNEENKEYTEEELNELRKEYKSSLRDASIARFLLIVEEKINKFISFFKFKK